MWKQRRRVQKLKRALMNGAQHAPCCHCNKQCLFDELTLDHVVPRSEGGCYTFDNVRLACEDCNIERGNEDFYVFNARKRAEVAGVSVVR